MAILVLATRNKDKVKEIKEVLSVLNLEIRSLLDYPDIPEVIEDGSTFEENALKKARAVFEYTNLPTLSDDSGLEVSVLGMKPGVYSARYAGVPTNYENNNAKLLDDMKNVPINNRQAQFRCIMVFMSKDIEEIAGGVCEGKIIFDPRGREGFGYDPLFIPEGYNQTFAEISPATKNVVSHRGRALSVMKKSIEEYFQIKT
jgi:XTP/dITP diphosphohydrolase